MELSRSLWAGIAAGSFVGIFFVGFGAIILLMQPSLVSRLAKSSFRGLSPVSGSALAAPAVVFAWSIIGILFGLVYSLLQTLFPGGGIGSPNLVYSSAVVGIALSIALLLLLFRRRFALIGFVFGSVFALAFGWLLPWLAS